MKMNYNQLYGLIDNANLEDNSFLEYRGIEFKIKYFDPEGTYEALAFMKEDKRTCCVLIKKDLSQEEKKLSLLHEIIEQCLMQFHGYRREGAHKIALEHEERYVRRELEAPKPNCA